MARWVHFEGRNIDQVVQQIDWLDAKASRENWRSLLTISVELEKPDRENIDLLMPRVCIYIFREISQWWLTFNTPRATLSSFRNCLLNAEGTRIQRLFCGLSDSNANQRELVLYQE